MTKTWPGKKGKKIAERRTGKDSNLAVNFFSVRPPNQTSPKGGQSGLLTSYHEGGTRKRALRQEIPAYVLVGIRKGRVLKNPQFHFAEPRVRYLVGKLFGTQEVVISPKARTEYLSFSVKGDHLHGEKISDPTEKTISTRRVSLDIHFQTNEGSRNGKKRSALEGVQTNLRETLARLLLGGEAELKGSGT